MTSEEPKGWTAAQYVAAARVDAKEIIALGWSEQALSNRWWVHASERPGMWTLCGMCGQQRKRACPYPHKPFSVELTPENIASEAAMTRALVASAVTMREKIGGPHVIAFVASLGEQSFSATCPDAAKDALLDALLAPTEAR